MKKRKREELKGYKREGRNTVATRLYPDELEQINNYRRIHNEAIEQGLDPTSVKHGWIKSKETSLFVKNHQYEEPKEKAVKELFETLINDLKQYSPNFKKIKRTPCNDGHLLVIDPADIHIGKLCSTFESGESYDTQTAVKRVREGVQGILDRVMGYDIEMILFVTGNDVLHIDTPNRKTTSGTPQDTSGMWYENVVAAKNIYIEVIEMMLAVAPVHCVFNPSNHDFMSGFMLLQAVEAWFNKCKDITFDSTMKHRKYFKYYNNLIGTTHGDGAKVNDLPLLMANESEDWSTTKKRYIYTHHIHHYKGKDTIGVTMESLRSPSGTDGWHHRNGYEHNPKAIEGFIHHPKHGQVNKLTYFF